MYYSSFSTYLFSSPSGYPDLTSVEKVYSVLSEDLMAKIKKFSVQELENGLLSLGKIKYLKPIVFKDIANWKMSAIKENDRVVIVELDYTGSPEIFQFWTKENQFSSIKGYPKDGILYIEIPRIADFSLLESKIKETVDKVVNLSASFTDIVNEKNAELKTLLENAIAARLGEILSVTDLNNKFKDRIR